MRPVGSGVRDATFASLVWIAAVFVVVSQLCGPSVSVKPLETALKKEIHSGTVVRRRCIIPSVLTWMISSKVTAASKTLSSSDGSRGRSHVGSDGTGFSGFGKQHDMSFNRRNTIF
jgi:hypothetical protein